MRNVSIMHMDIGDGFRFYVTLFQNGKVAHPGFSFEGILDPECAMLIENWLEKGTHP